MATNSSSGLRYMNKAHSELNGIYNKLSSGKRINKASDDAAGLAIANSLAVTVSLSNVGKRNIGDGTSALAIADGALQQMTDIGTRLSELATQSANGTLSDSQRSALNQEFQALTQEAQRIGATTSFNGKSLLDGNSIQIQAGTDSSADSQLTVEGIDGASLSGSVSSFDISTAAGASAALGGVSSFLTNVNSARGNIGAIGSRLDSARGNLDSLSENAAAARSRIEDYDIAEGVAQRAAAQIRLDASTAVSAQASGLSRDTVLKLLN